MLFPRIRSLIKILFIIVIGELAFIGTCTIIYGILTFLASRDAVLLVLFIAFSLIIMAPIALLIVFYRYLMSDFVELDQQIYAIRAATKKLKADKETIFDGEFIQKEVNEEKPVEVAPTVKKEAKAEPIKEQVTNNVNKATQVKDDETIITLEKRENLFIKGNIVVIKEDFTDYGLHFQKGMRGVIEKEPDENGIISVHMIDRVKGFFRFSIDQLEPFKEKKK